MLVLEAKSVSKIYGGGRGAVRHQALENISLHLDEGEFLGIMGASGSGKTTLLNILATIDEPSSGSVELNGVNPLKLKGDALALFRRRSLGFIFQDFNLLDTLTVKDNIVLPLVLDNTDVKEIDRRLTEIAAVFRIEGILGKRPSQISGGEQQRVAAARAIIHNPAVIMADEPTGNLDSRAARDLMETLSGLHRDKGASIAMVTHDPLVASFCQRILFIRDGKIYTEIRQGYNRQAFYQQILDVLSLLGGVQHDLDLAAVSHK